MTNTEHLSSIDLNKIGIVARSNLDGYRANGPQDTFVQLDHNGDCISKNVQHPSLLYTALFSAADLRRSHDGEAA